MVKLKAPRSNNHQSPDIVDTLHQPTSQLPALNMPAKMTIEEAAARLAVHGYEMVNPEMFKDTNTRMLFKCTAHNTTWEATTVHAYSLWTKCAACPTESWQDALARKKFTLQCSEEFANTRLSQGRVPVMCEEGHAFDVKLCYAKSHKCQECLGRKIPLEEVLRKMEVLGFTLVDQEQFTNTKNVGSFRCSDGHTWSTSIHNVYSEKSGCPTCGLGMNEQKTLWAISELTGKTFEKTRTVLPSGYELDGYCHELKVAFEYNGIQHYEFVGGHFHRDGEHQFHEQQERDNIKAAECEELGIALVTVPYTCKTFDAIWDFVQNRLQALNITVLPVDREDSQLKYQTTHRPKMNDLQELHDLAAAKGGVCLSNVYEGSSHPHMLHCANPDHPPFGMTKNDLKRGRWCRMCSSTAPGSIEKINSIISQHGFVFASERYINSSTKYDYRCVKCNTIHSASWENMKARCGRGCKVCKPAKKGRASENYPANPKPRAPTVIPDYRKEEHIETLREAARSKGGECLSEEYLGHQVKHRFRCDRGHEWDATSNAIKLGTWCAVCAGKKKDDIESARAFCQSTGWVFNSETYDGPSVKYSYSCQKCGFARAMVWKSFKARAANGCSQCKTGN